MRAVSWVVLGFFALFAAAQLVPYGRGHHNPPVTREAPWASPETRSLAVRACYDCHSNETTWPWYAYVAPASWLVERDVSVGRAHLNFSEWDRAQEHAEDAAEQLLEGEMPPAIYTLLHGDAVLDAAERRELSNALTFTAEPAADESDGDATLLPVD